MSRRNVSAHARAHQECWNRWASDWLARKSAITVDNPAG
jgi:hypothetical protein